MMLARENKARSGATLEGLENRKKDLLNTLRNDLNIDEKNLMEMSDLKNIELNSLFNSLSKNKLTRLPTEILITNFSNPSMEVSLSLIHISEPTRPY